MRGERLIFPDLFISMRKMANFSWEGLTSNRRDGDRTDNLLWRPSLAELVLPAWKRGRARRIRPGYRGAS